MEMGGMGPRKTPEPIFNRSEIDGRYPEKIEASMVKIYKEQVADHIVKNSNPDDLVNIEGKIVLTITESIKDTATGPVFVSGTISNPEFSFEIKGAVAANFLAEFEKQLHEKMAALALNKNSTYTVRTMDLTTAVYDPTDTTKKKFATGGMLVKESMPKLNA